MRLAVGWLLAGMSMALVAAGQAAAPEQRPRAREAGIIVGVLPPGPLDAITDVAGVLVGQATLLRGDDVRTGVTAVLPHGGNVFQEKVPAAVFVGNGFGKLMGSTQVEELGEIETPILLTSTLNIPRVADAALDYVLSQPGNERVQSVNVVAGETNDGYLNNIRSRPIGREEVVAALRSAKAGAVEEGSVGAGAGTVAFGFKGGIGTASRRLPAALGGYTVGVLVQTNFGGILTINGAPVGQELGQYYLKPYVAAPGAGPTSGGSAKDWLERGQPDGSCMMVVATDAPLDARNLRRIAARSIMGLARTGSSGSNGSGDYVVAFSAAPGVRIQAAASANPQGTVVTRLGNDAMSPLFEATIEATEEAIYNSLFKATTITGNGHTVEALPIARTLEILRAHKALAGANGPAGAAAK